MLSSLLLLLKKALRRIKSPERLQQTDAPRTEPGLDLPPVKAVDPRPLVQGFEMDYWRDSVDGLESQRIWVRVDTRELMNRLRDNPDIDLDSLHAKGAPEQPDFEVSDWHHKVRYITRGTNTRH